MSLKNIETLEIQSKKKKNKVIIVLVGSLLVLLGWSIISTLLSVDNSSIHEKRSLDKKDNLEIMKEPEFKEGWAISIENRFDRQNKKVEELSDLISNQQKVLMSDLKSFLNETNENMKMELSTIKEDNNLRINQILEKIEEESIKTKQEIAQIKEDQKNLQIESEIKFEEKLLARDLPKKDDYKLPSFEELQKMTEEEVEKQLKNALAFLDHNLTEAVLKNPDLSVLDKYNFANEQINENKIEEEISNEALEVEPEIDEPKIEEPISKKKKLKSISIDTSFNKKIISAQKEINENILSSEKGTDFEAYHISTGFAKAYMITGAYAPAFQEGSMEPLPVLFETEGDILMANHVSSDMGKCFLLGSAKGNMNSETAEIKLVSINCLINDGKYRIEGTISGWVIGENGIPGLQGEMIHKNGAWLARTFVSGFFETFSGALMGGNNTPINFGGQATGGSSRDTSVSGAISSNFLSAGGAGLSTVFSKLGEYYIKMAEQIFPVIEVKGGRTVNLLLMGGEDFTVVKNELFDIGTISDTATQIEREKELAKEISVEVNAFQKVSSENDFVNNVSEDSNSDEKNNNNSGFMSDIPLPL